MQIFFSSNLFDSKLTVTFNSLVVLLGIRFIPLFAAPPRAVPLSGIICGSAQDGNGIKVKCCQTFAPLDSICDLSFPESPIGLPNTPAGQGFTVNSQQKLEFGFGNIVMGAYSPTLGRWINRDPD